MSTSPATRGVEVRADMVAQVHTVVAAVGDSVDIGSVLVLLESMKMEIPVLSEVEGTVTEIAVSAGDVIHEGDLIAILAPAPRAR